jgi:FtsZ-interacting cell division protein YlmF
MGFKDAMRNIIGLGDDYDDYDDEVTQEEIDAEKAKIAAKKEKSEPMKMEKVEPASTGISYKAERSYESIAPTLSKNAVKKNYSMNGSGPFKMLVIEPKSFDECTKLVDNLKSRKPVIINLEKVETDLARKMFDFMTGATYALNGNIQRVTSNIFIFAPANVDIAAKLNRETVADPGKPTGYSGNSSSNETKSPWR